MSKQIKVVEEKIVRESFCVSASDFVKDYLQEVRVNSNTEAYFYVKGGIDLPDGILVRHFTIKKQLTDTEVHTLLMWEENVDDVVEFIEENLDE